jgi:hypothetical protein
MGVFIGERTGPNRPAGCTSRRWTGGNGPHGTSPWAEGLTAIAALEDKIVQGAVVMVLNALYEEDFLGFSYGFRPGRGPHDALDALMVGIASRRVNFILDADIRSFLDPDSYCPLVHEAPSNNSL